MRHLIASQTPRHRPGYLYEIGVRDFRAIAYLTNAAVNDVAHDERRDTLLTLARSATTTTPRASSSDQQLLRDDILLQLLTTAYVT